MNPWSPTKNKEEALRLFRLKGESMHSSLESLINSGWSVQGLINGGHVESIPQPPSLPVANPHPPLWNPFESAPAAGSEDDGARHEPSEITRDVVHQIIARDAHGQRKYGVSLDRKDLTPAEWLQHMVEEMMDGAHYALAAKREAERRDEKQRNAVSVAMNRAQDQAQQLMSAQDFEAVKRYLKAFWPLYQELSK